MASKLKMDSMAGSIAANWSSCLERYWKMGDHYSVCVDGVPGAEFTATEIIFCTSVEDPGGIEDPSRRNFRFIARPRRVRGRWRTKAGHIPSPLLSVFREGHGVWIGWFIGGGQCEDHR